MSARYVVTTAIPYVNGRPHVGHALELVQADVLARHRRQRGEEVRAQTGTDDNALKNVKSAEAEGIPTQEYVDRVAERFASLSGPLQLSFDDFVKTSSDPRHRVGVEKLWRACAAAGDFYQREYGGRYCVGCERYYEAEELDAGRCPEHGTAPEFVRERNWFFRLSRYQQQIADLVRTGALRIEPEHRRNEVLAFVEAGLEDFSVSRSTARARGWGIPVPGDPDQVVYVWWDALGNYITAPGYAADPAGYQHWWVGADQRVHVIGKGILRFHAVYWPAMLLSAGEPLPTTIFVHEYLTAYGRKISKSLGNAEDPADIAARYGGDALRWWLLRDVTRVGDTDFTADRLVARANEDLANTLGNLVNRTVSMVHRYRGGTAPRAGGTDELAGTLRRLGRDARAEVDDALELFDFRRALAAVVALAQEGNRHVEAVRPWDLAKAEGQAGAGRHHLDNALAALLGTCRDLAGLLAPFLPDAAARLDAQLAGDSLPPPTPVFPRIETGGLTEG